MVMQWQWSPPVVIGRSIGQWLGFSDDPGSLRGLALDMANMTIIQDLEKRDVEDHFLTTILACPPENCQQLRQRLRELNGNPLYPQSQQ